MHDSTVELLLKRQRLKTRSDSLNRALGLLQDELDYEGWISGSDDLIGKRIAYVLGPMYYDFGSYRVEDIIADTNGYNVIVHPDAANIGFYEEQDGVWKSVQRSVIDDGMELFIPYYQFNRMMVGDANIPAKPVDHMEIGWGRQTPKVYLSEAEILDQYPEAYEQVKAKLAADTGVHADLERQVKSIVEQAGVEFEIEGRTKTPEQTLAWLTAKPDRELIDLHDINAFRIVVADPNSCYDVLDALCRNMSTEWVTDWIAVPKTNCYQALKWVHRDPDKRLEVQIQTPTMRETAEFGTASSYRVHRPTE
ncbi:hypothetical protein ACFL1B_02405 [Nanoarchaeota archaeon]